mgnify:CR=1 FL=1
MKSLQENTRSVTLQAVLEDSACIIILNRFTEFMRILSTESGDLATYWMSYIDLVGILLDLIRASREGNWSLHIYSVRAIIPWCFAYDKQNYARYLPMYYSDMTRLVSDYPSVHKHLSEGGFSVQMGINPFGKLPVDQTLEETVNKDTQCPGGTKGFSLNAGATAKYYLTAEYRSAALGQLRSLINNNNTRIRHADLDEARIKRDEEDVTSICGILEMQKCKSHVPRSFRLSQHIYWKSTSK